LPYCIKPLNKWPINIDNVCKSVTSFNSSKKNEFYKEVQKIDKFFSPPLTNAGWLEKVFLIDVYIRERSAIVGFGHQCFSSEVTFSFGETFFFHPIDRKREKIIHLDALECSKMVSSNECGTQKKNMECEGSSCWFEPVIIPEYSWFYEKEIKLTKCRYNKIHISAEYLDSDMFGVKCKPFELSCKMHDSVIVWSNNTIHKCPFKRVIKREKFQITTLGFVSYKNNLNFVYEKVENHCGIDLLKMVEGFYIKMHDNTIELQDSFFRKTGADENKMEELDLNLLAGFSMASLDFVIKFFETDLQNSLLLNCKTFQTNLQLFAIAKNEEYIKIRNYEDDEIVLYVSQGFLYKPTCTLYDNIRIQKRQRNCQSLEIEINKNGSNGYSQAILTESGILINKPDLIKGKDICNGLRKIFKLSDRAVIIKQDRQANIINSRDLIEQETIEYTKSFEKIRINHSYLLNEELDIEKYITNDIFDNGDVFLEIDENNTLENKVNLINYFRNTFKKYYMILFWLSFFLLFVIFMKFISFIKSLKMLSHNTGHRRASA